MQVEQLDTDTRQWLDEHLQVAEEAGFGSTPPRLFEAFEQTRADFFIAREEDEELDPTPFMASFGIAVGEYLRRELGMDWVIINDDYGTDLAILRETPDGGQVYSCPIVVVGKRFDEDYEEGQLEQFCNHFLQVSGGQLGLN
ncbi:hypothetical protein COCCU_04175 [Corynebacterium occultum]|uniref:DUF3806 domain-containing protein n=1 Tax=Corynebacterium occultum TaxID=2675219 RepID=A0A6B8VRN5_9CORY|nr:DUF3806 domain-containing protein [Corynebacterium occultum]QGU06783.1 hypothetical protein COCCU_04175 [Corynebacterium occultum]